MKATTKISKSAVMTRAWSIYKKHRDMFPTFSAALTRAWAVEKANVVYNQKQQEEAEAIARYKRIQAENAKKPVSTSMAFMAESLRSYYANNTYNGD